MSLSDDNLPPLPKPTFDGWKSGGLLSDDGFTADQMHAYAALVAEECAKVADEADYRDVNKIGDRIRAKFGA